MQAVISCARADNGRLPAVVELEELRFLSPDGTALAEYGLAWSMDNACCSVRSMRLGGIGFGRMQDRPMSEAEAQLDALAGGAAMQPLRTPDGRWADGILLPAIHAAVTYEAFRLQLT